MTSTRKASKMEDDIEEIKKSMKRMAEELTRVGKELTDVGKKQTELTQLFDEVKQLKTEAKEKDEKIANLQSRVEQLEQYTRREDVVINGLDIKPRSYARAVVTGGHVDEDAPLEDLITLEMQVISFLESKDILLDPDNISACHTLPLKEKGKGKPAVIMRFVNRKHKTDLLKQGKKLKGTNVYINDHLTQKNGAIAKQARFLKKQKRIQSTWTRDCSVFIRLNADTPEEGKIIKVRELRDLDKYSE